MGRKIYIYRTINTVNGKSYIGSHITSDPNDGYLGSGTAIKIAIQKHGRESFKKEILEELITDNSLEREEYWIKELNTLTPNGYNICPKGGTFPKSAIDRDKFGFSGRKHTEETLKKMSKSLKGKSRKRSKESNKKTSETLRKKYSSGEVRVWSEGLKYSESTRKKISEGVKKSRNK